MSGWNYTLGDLARAVGGTLNQAAHTGDSFSAVSTDTRKIAQGDVFFALRGENYDADQFVDEAFARAGAILALQWSSVDLKGRRIDYGNVLRQKTRARAVPINDTLFQALTEAKEGAMNALPAGYEVSENVKTGLPLLKKIAKAS